MPTYVVHVPSGLLPEERYPALAEAVTVAHAGATGAPRSFAQVIVDEVGVGRQFIGGRPAEPATVFVHGHVRGGRSAEMLEELVRRVRDAVVDVLGVSADQVWVYLAALPPERMVEFGRVLPEPGGEAAWIEALPGAVRERLRRLDEPS